MGVQEESFLTDPSQPEIDIWVKNSPSKGCRTLVRGTPGLLYSLLVARRPQRHFDTANFVFVFKSNVPNELIPINPLGLAITYFREDEAFN